MPDCPENVIVVRRNADGSLDEIVAGDARGDGLFIHLEQMSATSWWLSIYHKGYRQTVWLHSKSAIAANSEMDAAPHPLDEASDDRPRAEHGSVDSAA
jgi:hypothetical protein